MVVSGDVILYLHKSKTSCAISRKRVDVFEVTNLLFLLFHQVAILSWMEDWNGDLFTEVIQFCFFTKLFVVMTLASDEYANMNTLLNSSAAKTLYHIYL